MEGTQRLRRGDTYGSWTVLGVGLDREGALAKLRGLEMRHKRCESPTTTLSIGMESLGDSGSPGEAAAPPPSLKKTLSWSNFDKLSSSPVSIKRKRDAAGSWEFGEQEIVLALGSSPPARPSVALGLGQADSGSGSGSACSPSITTESDIGLKKFSVSLPQDSLSLRLSRNSDEDKDGGLFLGIKKVVDEGSSSARWISAGGVMPGLLRTQASLPEQEEYHSHSENDPDLDIDVTTGAGSDKAPKACKFAGCKTEGCGKSAQGSTDFCKAHGGGKRCTWGQEGSLYGPREGSSELSKGPCDRFARGKLGLCAAHSSIVQEEKASGLAPGLFKDLVSQSSSGSIVYQSTAPASSSVVLEQQNHYRFLQEGGSGDINKCWSTTIQEQQQGFQQQQGFHHPVVVPVATKSLFVPEGVPEGRVHGGGLLALLAQQRSSG
ncbi:hypothetical protein SELMODRAFT_441219 [Selaginella moellendorffii]|uniref:Uncharacterized protein n=1 Tax=Selaginella moellendorffii TaxID=88036 RepID=D8RHE8_SELML|nr:hypothetical protein SELMODRAFT_441219 [Selaginella moellendorffii]